MHTPKYKYTPVHGMISQITKKQKDRHKATDRTHTFSTSVCVAGRLQAAQQPEGDRLQCVLTHVYCYINLSRAPASEILSEFKKVISVS